VNLSEKVIVITGAKGGLGNAVTSAFLEAGARVAGVSRSIDDTDFPHPRFTAVRAELSGGDAATTVMKTVTAKWGRIDALIHLVGGFDGGVPVERTTDAAIQKMFDLNFRSAFLVMRSVVPQMREQGSGRIVAIGSRAGLESSPMLSAYAASKAALLSLVRTLAVEIKNDGITVNAVLPAMMDTPANRAAMPEADPSKWIQPKQVANLLLYLVSDEAASTTGALLPLYGREL